MDADSPESAATLVLNQVLGAHLTLNKIYVIILKKTINSSATLTVALAYAPFGL